jgi:type I restriction-modification system DNA methylase subunit
MAKARTKVRSRDAQLGFEALAIEGGLLSPEWLSKVAQLTAEGQNEADYRIPKGLNLRDEIGRYWRIAQAYWQDLNSGIDKADPSALAERFVLGLLRESFGFASLTSVSSQVLAERAFPIGHAALDGRVPVVIAPAGTGLDTLSPAFGDGTRRRSAFGLAQEYLNTQKSALWGITSDGYNLRILRDNASLTRPAWIEADLRRIFTEERYADFAALWLLMHETRFGRPDQPVTECSLDAWRNAGREEGTRAREQLRQGVEEALKALGQGFLAHPDNQVLRTRLQKGELNTRDLFNQLLRLVYRFIFLLTVEERELLHPSGTSDAAKALYAQGYSLKRLRARSVKRSAHDRFSDLWESTKIVFRGTEKGETRLGLPALAGIFSKSQCPSLDSSKLENRALLLAVWRLAWLRQDGALARVNWRDMGPEELGSVYESLLELVPQITEDGRKFAFATGGETKGNARKTTGSYYTPDSLVQVLLDSALEPVIADTIAKNPEKPVDALLGLSILDPACGSGHFLLGAADRLAWHVARLQANGTPSGADHRHALRQVIGHCIYGVDLNPMAVELCKVSLWMRAVEPGLPLTFLDSHIQHGNALLGTTPELMEKGIPDAAWEPIEGDDKKAASALKKKNKIADHVAYDLFASQSNKDAELQAVRNSVSQLESENDASAEELKHKESRWDSILSSAEYRHQKFVADAWCSAFVWPKQPGEMSEAAPTNELWRQIRDAKGTTPELTIKTVTELAGQYTFFHWHLQFPHVFAKGGFDVVLGNPPWERVKLQEQEFFASRSEEIANAVNAAIRKKLIEKLPEVNRQLSKEWNAASREAEGESHSIRQSGRYPLCGKGDINTYALFAEHNRSTLGPCGRAGFIVPTGIATDDTTKEYFGTLVNTRCRRSPKAVEMPSWVRG